MKNTEFSCNVSAVFLDSTLFKIRPEYGVSREEYVVVSHNSSRQMLGWCIKQVTVTLIPNSLFPSTLYILRFWERRQINKKQENETDFVEVPFCSVNGTCYSMLAFTVRRTTFLFANVARLSLRIASSKYFVTACTQHTVSYCNRYLQQLSIVRAERDCTRAETRFRLSPETDESIQIGGGVSSVDCWQPRCAHQL